MILLSRHPADQWARPPAELDRAMSTGRWPEQDRTLQLGDTPVEALGSGLHSLFDAAFSLDPMRCPSADQWRRGLLAALKTCWIHRCGQAFVGDKATSNCPWCGDPVAIQDGYEQGKWRRVRKRLC